MKYEDLKEALEYITINSNDVYKKTRQQIVEYLKNKYPGSEISIDLEKELFHIGEVYREEILTELKEIGIIK